MVTRCKHCCSSVSCGSLHLWFSPYVSLSIPSVCLSCSVSWGRLAPGPRIGRKKDQQTVKSVKNILSLRTAGREIISLLSLKYLVLDTIYSPVVFFFLVNSFFFNLVTLHPTHFSLPVTSSHNPYPILPPLLL